MANVRHALKPAGAPLIPATPAPPAPPNVQMAHAPNAHAPAPPAPANAAAHPQGAQITAPIPSAMPAEAAANQVQELKVTGHMMSLPAGLFSIINEPHVAGLQQGGMPGVRISPPPVDGEHIEIVGFRADGWLNADGDAVLVRARRPGHILVTIYQLPNQPDAAPKIQVRQLMAGAPQPVAEPGPAAAPSERADMMAHIQSRGDVGVKFGVWLGEPGSNNWIEGFALAVPEGIAATDLSYQAVLGRGWLSPWVDAGEYCGSRGMALPLLGLRIRLTGAAAEHYDISCQASFVGGTSAGPVGNDETCEGDALAPLEAMLVTLTPHARKHGRGKR